MAIPSPYSLLFNGVNSYVYSEKSASLNIGNKDAFTIEFWFKINSIPNSRSCIFSFLDPTSNKKTYDKSVIINSDFSISFYLYNGSANYVTTKPHILERERWTHFAGVFDGNNAYIYLDGLRIEEKNNIGSTYSYSVEPIISFSGSEADSLPFDGAISEFRLWKMARSDDEIQRYKDKRISHDRNDNLVHYYKMTEGTGKTIKNATKLNGNATLYNVGWVQDTPIKPKQLLQLRSGQYLSFANSSNTTIPQMTSYTTPSGKVEDSGNILTWEGVTYSGWNLFNKFNHWATVNTTTGWVSYEFETPPKIVCYRLTAPSLDANLNRMAKDWEILAFDSRSNSWIVLDKQMSQTGWKRLEKREYKLNNINNYKKYKFNVTANNGAASNLQVFRLELLAQNSIDCITKDEISASDFERYGMSPDIIAAHIKNSVSKKRLIATKSKVLETGKTFEHEVDLKKYEVNEIMT
ncbi:LamG domain-containing protein [Paenibacillus thiaminolyticus]|uniref:LamG domain-containing protein n=1 Tax=Paenibacillus thiaminolyticus TaxID=49283 RepID=UPI00232B1E1A|nr:LamG domain-containing protein [Paenibacillus thiaminolyticus]WCF06959.1 LamG domain-containing protein [Paenibacillus thiaminolyticus]